MSTQKHHQHNLHNSLWHSKAAEKKHFANWRRLHPDSDVREKDWIFGPWSWYYWEGVKKGKEPKEPIEDEELAFYATLRDMRTGEAKGMSPKIVKAAEPEIQYYTQKAKGRPSDWHVSYGSGVAKESFEEALKRIRPHQREELIAMQAEREEKVDQKGQKSRSHEPKSAEEREALLRRAWYDLFTFEGGTVDKYGDVVVHDDELFLPEAVGEDDRDIPGMDEVWKYGKDEDGMVDDSIDDDTYDREINKRFQKVKDDYLLKRGKGAAGKRRVVRLAPA